MNSSLTTWRELSRLEGNILLITNSDPAETTDELFDLLAAAADSGSVFAIAEPRWRERLRRHGIDDDRVRYCVDDQGALLELNHFLRRGSAASWVAAKQCAFVIGTSGHAIHNDEVKDIFEQSVCLLLGSGTFLAHTLPEPYVFRFDLLDLAQRLGRDRTRDQYVRDTRALVAALHAQWQKLGQPTRGGDAPEPALSVMHSHLPREVMQLSEHDQVTGVPADAREAVGRLGDFVRAELTQLADDRDRVLRQTVAGVADLSKSYQELRSSYQERVEAVTIRDRIIDDLRSRELRARIRRWLGRGQ